jgi:N-acetylmuramoyl-L-alanine amidase
MESHWLASGVLGTLSAVVIAAPARAATLQYWWFDAQANQLVFTTDAGVQPRAQMVFGPTRVVIDLPNTQMGGATTRQAVGGAIREVRAGQFDRQTTRLVIELAADYTLDPQAVRVQGVRPNQWVVQLPTPVQAAPSTTTPPGTTIPPPSTTANQVHGNSGTGAEATLNGVVTTGDGFLIKMSGVSPEPTVEIRGDGPDDRIAIIDLPNTAVAADLRPNELPNYRYSIIAWEIVQQSTTPASTRITLRLAPGSPDWRVLRNSSGVIVLPPSGIPISSVLDEPLPTVAATPPPGSAATPASSVQPARPVRPVPPTAQPAQRPTDPLDLPSIPNQQVVVVIDPGHGGRDPGAVGINGLQEKQVIFPISLRVAQLLEQQGVAVVLTRQDDRTLDLQARVDIANRARGSVFVSIHANAISLSRPDVNGIETYYASETGYRLAAALQASVLAATGMNDRGVKQARFYVLRYTAMPAALVEVGFVTGAQDAPRLADPAWQETIAQAIARGILQYVQQGM